MTDDDAGILMSELRHVVEDLQGLVGLAVQDAWVPAPHVVILRVGRALLHLETWPIPRVHTTARRPPAPPRPYSFQGLLRARLRGTLDAIRLLGDDRVVELDVGPHTLHVRLFGRGGGIWLRRGESVVAASDGPAATRLPDLPHGAPVARPPRFTPVEGEGWSQAACRFFGHRARIREQEALVRRLGAHLARLERKQLRLLEHLRGDLDRAARADALRHQADCLAAALHRVPRGASAVEVEDLAHPGAMLRIPLDPRRTPAQQMNHLYDKARRLDRSRELLVTRIDEAEARARAIAAARAQAQVGDVDALRELAVTWELPAERPRPDAPSSHPWQVWRGPHGEVLKVGRSDRANHALVFRHARGRDWWVHVRERPGAHVVIPMQQTATPSLDLLLAAAQLALRASRVPEGETLDVQYARVADLRPIKGAPGKVIVTSERVLHVTADPGYLRDWVRAS